MEAVKECLRSVYRWFFLRPSMQRWNQFLVSLGLNGIGIQNYRNRRQSGEEFILDIYLSRRLGRSPVIFDVGANQGAYTSLLRSRFPAATIHAFEPHPNTARSLKDRLGDADIFVHELALSDSDGESLLYSSTDRENDTFSSARADVIEQLHHRQAESVRVCQRRLDTFCAEKGIHRIDFLKIDTEGSELAVLEGAGDLLRSGRIQFIQFEFNEMSAVFHTRMADFLDILKHWHLYRTSPRGLIPLGDRPMWREIYGFQNILAVPERQEERG